MTEMFLLCIFLLYFYVCFSIFRESIFPECVLNSCDEFLNIFPLLFFCLNELQVDSFFKLSKYPIL